MRHLLITIFTAFIIISCSKNKFEKQLIGTWNNYPTSGSSHMNFYKDSIISFERSVKRKGTWKASRSQIKLHFPQKNIGYSENFTLDYKLNKNGDSLFIKNIADSIYRTPVLFRITNDWQHYLKEIGLQIELPTANFELTRKDSTWLGIDLYVAYKNDSVIIKNEYGIELNNRNDFLSYLFGERGKIKDEEIDKMTFNLIVDKAVSEQKVDSIKALLKEMPKMKIFRVYEKFDSDYGDFDLRIKDEKWNWYGKYE